MKNEILLETGTNELEIVEFSLHYVNKKGEEIRQSFGLNVAKVREFIPMPKVTKMPDTHPSVLGVFTLRNSTITALDLAKHLFGMIPDNDERRIMIVSEFNNMRWGFIVSNVNRIHRISWDQITGLDGIQKSVKSFSSANGVVTIENREILMLDIEKVIAEISPDGAFVETRKVDKFEGKMPIIFTAEDSSMIREFITKDLRKGGFEVEPFEDGQKCWNKINHILKNLKEGEKVSDFVDLVVTDIEMPQMDGYTLTKKIKETPKLSKMPVIIFSSIVADDVIHKGQSVGADAQLTKPQLVELQKTVRKLLNLPYDDLE